MFYTPGQVNKITIWHPLLDDPGCRSHCRSTDYGRSITITEYRKNRERTPPVVRASGVGSARSVLEVNGNNAL